jgi:hypothetical protein
MFAVVFESSVSNFRHQLTHRTPAEENKSRNRKNHGGVVIDCRAHASSRVIVPFLNATVHPPAGHDEL